MSLRVIGAGVGRTGTHSLKLALERVLGAPCHHMAEVFAHPDTVPIWHAAARGEPVDWEQLLDGYVASVDWPGGAFWREQLAVWPDAIVLLSERDDPATWYASADRTILEGMRSEQPPHLGPWHAMFLDLLRTRFDLRFDDRGAFMAAYERHNAEVRAEAPPDQLVVWRPGDGWGPICDALGVPVPDEPFPHSNSTAEFRAMRGWE